jgi:hypothetical protein
VRRHPLLVLMVMGLALFGMATVAHAGPVVISLEQVPTALEAGRPFTVGFRVTSHGEQGRLEPIAGLAPIVTATRGDERVQVVAEAAAAPGHYQATLTLPGPGTWDWEIAAFGGPEAYALTPLQVAEAGGMAVAPGTSAEPAGAARGLRSALSGAGIMLLLVALALPFVQLRKSWLWRRTRSA